MLLEKNLKLFKQPKHTSGIPSTEKKNISSYSNNPPQTERNWSQCGVFSFKIGTGKSSEHVRRPRHDLDGISPADFVHHNYIAMESFLKDLNSQYPEITRLTSIGKSVEKRELYVLEVTKDPGKHIPGKFICLLLEAYVTVVIDITAMYELYYHFLQA